MTTDNYHLSKEDPIVVDLVAKFEEIFGCKPTIAGRAPGRVNVIGEHIDYCGFSVIPMALSGIFTTVVMKPNDSGKLRIRNYEAKYEGIDVDIKPYTEYKGNQWCRYVESAVKTFCDYFKYELNGLDLLLWGQVPIGSGLSSSAALLCSIIVALNHISRMNIDKATLVDCAIQAEHRLGVMVGGMDQAIAILAEKGYADIISTYPRINYKPVKLPRGHFVIAHCGQYVKDNQSEENCYKRRLAETARCAELMMPGAKNISQIVDKWGWDKTLEFAEKLPEREGDLVLRDRAIHVVNEAHRVWKIEGSPLERWCRLMANSQASCRDKYQCSCKALDELIETGLQDGALGGRLTGAGWGGCAIFLLKEEQDPQSFIFAIKKQYYEPRGIKDPVIFATSPGEGAHFLQL